MMTSSVSRLLTSVVFIIILHVTTAGPRGHRDAESSVVMVTVPSTARPGHVVTVLDLPHGHRGRLLRTGAASLVSYQVFTLHSHGRLVTRRTLSDLSGKTLVVNYLHIYPDDSERQESLNVLVINSDNVVQFTHQPYHGTVEENLPAGTVVQDLTVLHDDVMTLPYGCTIRLTGHDSDLVSLEGDPPVVITKVELDRERRAYLHIGIEAACPGGLVHAMLTVRVVDVNDNYPQMDAPFYTETVHNNAIQVSEPFVRVHATDLDDDEITYEMDGNRLFTIDPATGEIRISNKAQLFPRSFELTVYAVDKAQHRSEPSFVRIELVQSQSANRRSRIHRRDVRDAVALDDTMATRDVIIQVIRLEDEGDLFTVALDLGNSADERFEFYAPDPEGLALDVTTGMISLIPGYVYNDTTVLIDFTVNVTSDSDPNLEDQQPVEMHIVPRQWEEPIFTNTPQDMFVVIPEWIRPDTTIYTVQAIDSQDPYFAPISYQIESGSEDCFMVDRTSGEVRIACRRQFVINKNYRLAISAQIPGTAPKDATETQILRVQVGMNRPQFYQDYSDVKMSESTGVGDSVVTIQTIGFQGVPVTYSLQYEDTVSPGIFALDTNTGVVSLLVAREHIRDPHQYRMIVTATEDVTGLMSTTDLIINLEGENLHAPYFPGTVYPTETNILETLPVSSIVLQVEAVDLDQGSNGMLRFFVDHPNFEVTTTDGTIADVKVAIPLDYDRTPLHRYDVTLTAVDMGTPPLSATTQLRIWMQAETDEPPVMEPQQQTFRVNQDAPSTTEIHVIQAYDPDINDTLVFAFGDGNTEKGPYSIDPATGYLSLSTGLTPDASTNLTIRVTDDTGRETFGNAVVEVIGVNHPATFPQCNSYTSVSLKEHDPIGTFILNLTVVDKDSGVNGDLTFDVLHSQPNIDVFALGNVANTGNGTWTVELVSAAVIDREGINSGSDIINGGLSYQVTVLAKDNGSPQLATNCFFFVQIDDVNDKEPLFDESEYRATIPSILATSDRVIRMFAVDQDEGSNADFTYLMVDDTECTGCFSLNPATGWITKGSGVISVDMVYTLMVTWEDAVNTGKSINVIITVTDNQDQLPPLWKNTGGLPIDDVTTFQVYENETWSPIPSLNFSTNKVGILETIRGQTPYENANFDFKGNGEQSLILRVAADLNYESVPRYSVRIRASTQVTGDLSYTDARAAITLIDVNDMSPQFVGTDEGRTYPAGVSDQTRSGDEVVKVTAIDTDGSTEHNTVTYHFHPGCSGCDLFDLETTTGQITATQSYSPDVAPEYFLTVYATDNSPSPNNGGQPLSATATVRVEVTGSITYRPYFPDRLTTISVDSGIALDTTVHTLMATDPTGQSALQYTIRSGNEGRRFAVDILTGRIYNVHEILYEEITSYDLTCGVFDGLQTNTTVIHITVTPRNVYPPVFTPRWLEYINRLENTSGLITVGTVSATDPEGDTAITYSIEGTYANMFIISGQDIQIDQSMDRDYPDGHADWLVTVAAQDSSANPSTLIGYSLFTVRPQDINDNPPWFDNCCLRGQVLEDAAMGSSVLQLMAEDYDEDGSLTLTYGAIQFPQDGGTDIFVIDPNTGLISTNVIPEVFNRTAIPRYKASVYVVDSGGIRTNQTIDIIVLDANDHRPVFDADVYDFEMREDLPVSASVGAVYATDDDVGENAQLVFTIDGGPPYFYMDSLYMPQAGVIRIAQTIDYEDQSIPMTFTLAVIVSDGVDPTSTTTVHIQVLDANDNAPVISPASASVTLVENKLNSSLQQYTAQDTDTGTGGEVSFIIDYENTDPDKKFWIDPISGWVSAITELDWEITPSYQLNILAVDAGVPAMTGTAQLNVTVGNADDSAPFGIYTPLFPVVGSTTVVGTEVVTITLYDNDSLITNTNVNYDCINEPFCQDFTFSYVSTLGIGTLSAALNGYSRTTLGFSYYDLPFTFSDNAGNTVIQVVRVHVESINTESHTAGESFIYVFNHQAYLPDTQIGRVYCEDADDWDLADKQFTPEVDYAYFNVSTTEGVITMRRGAPRGEHVLRVQVEDTSFGTSAVCTVNVNIYYVYDAAVGAAGSIRITGFTSEEFILREEGATGTLLSSKYDLLQQELATLAGVTTEDVMIFSVIDLADYTIDVIYAVENVYGQYYRSSKIDGLVWANKDQLNAVIGGTITQSPVSLCTDDSCFGSGCETIMNVTGDALPVFTNQTSMVGVGASMVSECTCPGSNPTLEPPTCQYYTCANNGTCEEYYNGYRCFCLDGFDGPQCEQTKLSFTGNNWAWFDHLPACDVMKISLDITTTVSNALLLYNGPMYNQAEAAITDYMVVQLEAGYPVVKVDVGNGELSLTVNGQDMAGDVIMQPLNDGQWHTIEIYKNGMDFSLMVDHCTSVGIDESLNGSLTDRTPCEVTLSTQGVHHLINVNTPLELGGRARPGIDHPVVEGNTFDGCIRNVWINGLLYDLHLGDVGHGEGVVDDCPRESCGACPGNSTCSGPLDGSSPVCTCMMGYTGAMCDVAPVGDFNSFDSYIEWRISDMFNNTFGDSFYQITHLHLQFRTREESGVIFETNSFSTLERAILEVVSSYLQFRYDLGEGDTLLTLPYVNVSDGVWHTVLISRYGNQVIMHLDGGEGKYQAEVWPTDGFRNLIIAPVGTYGGAHVVRNNYSTEVTVSLPLVNSCIRDVRLNREWFPMMKSQNPDSKAADVEDVVGVDDLCDSDACSGVTCVEGFCSDIWREFMCLCPMGAMFDVNGICVPITDCSIERCVWGDCVMIPDVTNPPDLTWRCNCYVGWAGSYCNETAIAVGTAVATVSNGWIGAVIGALILLLILLLIVVCCTKKRKAGLLDEPECDKEMIMDYNEEGAGEEDMQGYDLRPLQKPVDRPVDGEPPAKMVRMPNVEDLPRAAPEPMHVGRAPIIIPSEIPRDYPDVGKFLVGRLGDADVDPTAPPYDSVREYEFEGDGSVAGSLSSIQTSSSGGDADMDYLMTYGAPFRRLAELYLGENEDDDDEEQADGNSAYPRQLRIVEDTDRARDLAQHLAYKRAIALQQVKADATQGRGILRNAESRQGLSRQSTPRGSQHEVTYADQERERELTRDDYGRDYGERHDYEDVQDRAYAEQRAYGERGNYVEPPEYGDRRDFTGENQNVTREQSSASYMGLHSGHVGGNQIVVQERLQPEALQERIQPQSAVILGDSGQETQGSHVVTTTRVTHHSTRHHSTHHRDERGIHDTQPMYADERELQSAQTMYAEERGPQGAQTMYAEERGPQDAHDYSQHEHHTMDQQLYTGHSGNAGSMQLDYQGVPPGSQLSTNVMTGASARVVKTEHASWTETKHVRKMEDYGDV